jgi:hypothetical protein
LVKPLLTGWIERSMFWKRKKLWLKSRPDSIPADSGDFVDLKTAHSVKWLDLQDAIFDNGYFMQGALVRMAAREVLGIDNATFTLIFVEKKSPWCVETVEIKSHDLDRGEQVILAALDKIEDCLKSKKWPGPNGDKEDMRYIEMREWQQKQVDDKLKFGF